MPIPHTLAAHYRNMPILPEFYSMICFNTSHFPFHLSARNAMQCMSYIVCVKGDFYHVLFACCIDSHLLALEYIIDCYQSAMCVCVGVSINCKGNIIRQVLDYTFVFIGYLAQINHIRYYKWEYCTYMGREWKNHTVLAALYMTLGWDLAIARF